MAYFIDLKNGKAHLYSTKNNGVLDSFGKNITAIDIQGSEIVLYKKNKIEIYKVVKGKVKGPLQVRRG